MGRNPDTDVGMMTADYTLYRLDKEQPSLLEEVATAQAIAINAEAIQSRSLKRMGRRLVDRVVHNSYKISLTGNSMRKQKGKSTADCSSPLTITTKAGFAPARPSQCVRNALDWMPEMPWNNGRYRKGCSPCK